ncbi:MAG: hypothetical protein GYA14_00755 [Ignavibacteria bacterium]|nr:hypothetical protein [Ignavibacteria bacterium]
MALLEQINSMKKSGKSSQEIIKILGEQGISPREINEALSQMDIKSAVSAGEDMQPSIMQTSEEPPVAMPAYSEKIPSPPTNQDDQSMQSQEYQPEQYAQNQQIENIPNAEQEQYAQPDYAQGYDSSQAYAPYQQPVDIETIRDISSQIIEDSIGKLKEQMNSVIKIKADVTLKMQEIENRLEKVESVIQQLQFSIIKKMGEYGESISDISKEIRTTQDSFSKLINPILDKKRGIQEEPSLVSQEEKQPKNQTKKGGKSNSSFEDYLR